MLCDVTGGAGTDWGGTAYSVETDLVSWEEMEFKRIESKICTRVQQRRGS